MNNSNVKVNFYGRRTIGSIEANTRLELLDFEIDGVYGGYIVKRFDDQLRSSHSVYFHDGNGDRDFKWPSTAISVRKYVCEFANRRATVAAPQDLTGYSWPR